MSFRFPNRLSAPPGGAYFFELNGDRVHTPVYDTAIARVAAVLAKHGVSTPAHEALADYMCPRLGPAARWFCIGDGPDVGRYVTRVEALENSEGYCSKPVATFDRIEQRLIHCMSCPKHERNWCLTCTGHLDRLIAGFHGCRPRLPEDKGTGVCSCARAYEAAICSVEYGDEKIWEGTPQTCWRYTDV